MTTWHQAQPFKRALAAGRFIHPWAHPTKWQVIENPPGQMAVGWGKFDTEAEATELALSRPHMQVIPPRGIV
jgi:hypothetical protein